MTWAASRERALARLEAFLPRAGSHYQRLRNHDFGPDDRSNVSLLSPYLRHRLLLDQEVLSAVLGRFAASTVDKFVQEVFWRSYFKGWLEHHPQTWHRYRAELERDLADLASDDDLALRYQAAVAGETGIEAFDVWARELTATGYLHNHARMWTASIWLFTLKLPWTLGADWFLRQLLDGDPASNTLSWRWVAGLHTRGKTYLARPDNIVRYAGQRFGDGPGRGGLERLATVAEPLQEAEPPAAQVPDWPAAVTAGDGRVGLLLGEDDLHLAVPCEPLAVAALAPLPRSPLPVGLASAAFTRAAVDDALARAAAAFPAQPPGERAADPAAVVAWARRHELDRVVMAYAPVGPGQLSQRALRGALGAAGIELVTFLRDLDRLAWPHARRGYFQLRKQIPRILAALAD